ncbi:MAG: DUF433 domain-containing protein [Candidatus Nanohaloarchaea archaeon]|nr:DUF433 domain-containing protein [Candidatus Nanohaloarchaea archaeon]
MAEVMEKRANILIDPEICNGAPVIEGTRTRVLDVAIAYEYKNMSPDDIVDHYPQLDLGGVHAALSYFYDHLKEMKRTIKRKDNISG